MFLHVSLVVIVQIGNPLHDAFHRSVKFFPVLVIHGYTDGKLDFFAVIFRGFDLIKKTFLPDRFLASISTDTNKFQL
jgi:hypothetical protein